MPDPAPGQAAAAAAGAAADARHPVADPPARAETMVMVAQRADAQAFVQRLQSLQV